MCGLRIRAEAYFVKAAVQQRREFGPPEIRSLDQWVVTKLTPKPGRPNNKPPYVQNGHGALRLAEGAVDSRRHMPYSLAASLVRDGVDGMQWTGFVTLPDGHITGLDIDNCRSPSGSLGFARTKLGTLGFWTPALVAYLPTYWSVSPSGRGLRAWLLGDVPDGPSREGGHGKWTRIGLEAYSQGQYLTETGLHLRGSSVHAVALQSRLALVVSAADVLNQAMEKPGRLLDLWSSPGDSETDLSLASRLARFTRDPEVLELLLRLSGAYREKWDEGRGSTTWLVREVVEPALASPSGADPADLGAATERRLLQLRADRAAREALAQEDAAAWSPPVFVDSARAWMAEDIPDPEWLIQDLWVEGSDILFAAEWKKGKTTTVLNVVRSLLDGVPFLGFSTKARTGRVAYLNAEMPKRHFRKWVRDLAVRNDDDLSVLNTQGDPLDLRLPRHQAWLTSELRRLRIRTLVIDTFAALFRGDENSNTEVAAFFRILDAIKLASGVSNLLVVHHTGRAQEAGREHGRGASYFEGWNGARWILAAEGDSRFFNANGRDVDVSDLELEYDEVTRLLSRSSEGRTRSEARKDRSADRMDALCQSVLMFVRKNPGCSALDVRTGLGGRRADVSKAVKLALQRQLVEDRSSGATSGFKIAMALFPVEAVRPSKSPAAGPPARTTRPGRRP